VKYLLQVQCPDTRQWLDRQREPHTESGRAILEALQNSMVEPSRIISVPKKESQHG
jgi:hypothetical protein